MSNILSVLMLFVVSCVSVNVVTTAGAVDGKLVKSVSSKYANPFYAELPIPPHDQ